MAAAAPTMSTMASDGAHLVEVDVGERHLVHGRLRLAQPAEDAPRELADARLERRRGEHRVDGAVGALRLRPLDVHVERRGDDAAPVRVPPVEVEALDRQRRHRVLDDVERHPQIEQRRDGHVPARPSR